MRKFNNISINQFLIIIKDRMWIIIIFAGIAVSALVLGGVVAAAT